MNIENKNAVSIQNQTKIKYYGHGPQLHRKIFNTHFLVKKIFCNKNIM